MTILDLKRQSIGVRSIISEITDLIHEKETLDALHHPTQNLEAAYTRLKRDLERLCRHMPHSDLPIVGRVFRWLVKNELILAEVHINDFRRQRDQMAA